MTRGMGVSPHHPKGVPYWRPQVSLFCILATALLLGSSALLMRWALAPPASSRRFATPPPRVVLAMGTMGGRANYLPDHLPSLFNQTWPVDKLIISINKGDVDTMLLALDAYGPFTREPDTEGRVVVTGRNGTLVLQFLEKSWGPGTKLVGAYLLVGSAPDTVIITVDDDCWYPPNLVESMMNHLPADHGALSGYCEMPLSWLPGKWTRMDAFYFYGQRYYPGHVVECQGWLMGFGGVLYWASTLDDRLMGYLSSLPPGCFYHDDVWLSGYLHKSGIKRYFMYGMPLPRHGSHHTNLSIHSDSNTQIEHQLPCVKHFNYFKPV